MKQAKIILVILLWGIAAIITVVAAQIENASIAPQMRPNIKNIIKTTYNSCIDNKDGKIDDCNYCLKNVNAKTFGIAIVTTDGKIYETGDTEVEFGIGSIEKLITLCLAMQQSGEESIIEKVGADATVAITGNNSNNPNSSVSPLIKAGALTTLSLVTKDFNQGDKWKKVDQYFDRFAGHNLKVIDQLYELNTATYRSDKTMALSLFAAVHLLDNPELIYDIDAKLHSYGVTTKDLAIMAATLASGGVNPVTKERLVECKYIPRVLSLMGISGLNEKTGEWMFHVGLPAMSSLGGGMIAIVPGKYGIAVFAPLLDNHGNSVKGQMVISQIAEKLNANIYKFN